MTRSSPEPDYAILSTCVIAKLRQRLIVIAEGAKRLSAILRKIVPSWIGALDQLDLPRALPFLEPLLRGDRFDNVAKILKINQSQSAVFLNEDRAFTLPMLSKNAWQCCL